MWTVGRNAGNLWNTANWYNSSGSLHQILLAYWERTDLGCAVARLQKVRFKYVLISGYMLTTIHICRLLSI